MGEAGFDYRNPLNPAVAAFVLCTITGYGTVVWVLSIYSDNTYRALLFLFHFWLMPSVLTFMVCIDYINFGSAPQFYYLDQTNPDQLDPDNWWYTRLNRTKYHRRLLHSRINTVLRNLIGFVFFLPPFLIVKTRETSSFVAILFILIEAFQLSLIYRRCKLYYGFFMSTSAFGIATSCYVFGCHHSYTKAIFYVSLAFIFLRSFLLHFDKNKILNFDIDLVPHCLIRKCQDCTE